MTTTRFLVGLAALLQGYVLVVWVALWGIIRPSVWWTASVALLLILLYRIAEFRAQQPYEEVVTFVISLFMAWAARLTKVQIKAQKAMAENVRVVAKLPNEINPEPTTFARELALILNQFREKTAYYEEQAEKHHFPRFEDRECKADRAP